jgi:hypothetical protein
VGAGFSISSIFSTSGGPYDLKTAAFMGKISFSKFSQEYQSIVEESWRSPSGFVETMEKES